MVCEVEDTINRVLRFPGRAGLCVQLCALAGTLAHLGRGGRALLVSVSREASRRLRTHDKTHQNHTTHGFTPHGLSRLAWAAVKAGQHSLAVQAAGGVAVAPGGLLDLGPRQLVTILWALAHAARAGDRAGAHDHDKGERWRAREAAPLIAAHLTLQLHRSRAG